jgi:hypothetical protein
MAIIVDEDKKKTDFATPFGWLVIIVIILAAAYYILIAPPEAAVFTPPSGFQDITQIVQISFDPSTVTNSAEYQALKQYVAEPSSTGPAAVGRSNPFIAP